jgi:hypothetical protein
LVSSSIFVWCARLVWLVLPVATGAALADALDSWSSAPAHMAAALLWTVWAVALLALLAPRPWGLTVLRIAAPAAVVCIIAALFSTTFGAGALGLTTSLVAAVLVLSSPMNEAAANALAYGDERRFPLRIPTPLLLAPVPLGVAVVGAGIATGPLLLAAGHVAFGIVALVIGLPLAFAAFRSLHTLSLRWLVVVPAGLTIVDPLTLFEPALLRRDEIASIRRTTRTSVDEGTLDLRLGTIPGGVAIALHEPYQFGRRRGRNRGEVVAAVGAVIAVVRADALLALAAARHLNVA